MDFVLGERLDTKPCVFRVKWLQPAMKIPRVAGAAVVRTVMAVSMCFASSCALQLHRVLEAGIAKRIVMAASRLLAATACA